MRKEIAWNRYDDDKTGETAAARGRSPVVWIWEEEGGSWGEREARVSLVAGVFGQGSVTFRWPLSAAG